jgi:ATP-dependent Lon protease
VLTESAQAAVSYVRSQSEVWKLDQAWFRSRDIHVHLPQGAIPKDGPSAGVALATAIVSLVSGQKVRSDVAMTGEISFRGLVLPIGGVKEKLLAARRAGIRTVVIPEDNQDEAISLGSEVIDGLSIVPVKTLDQVLALALIPSPDDSIMAGCLPDPAAAVLPGGVRWDSGITSLSL